MSGCEIVLGGPKIPPNKTEIYRVNLKKGETKTFKEQEIICLSSGKVRIRDYDPNVKIFDANAKTAEKKDQTVTINVGAGVAVVIGNEETTVAVFRVFKNKTEMSGREIATYNKK